MPKTPAAIEANSPKKFLNRRSLAHRWDCSRDTVRRMQERGDIKPTFLFGKVVYAIEEVERAEREATA